MAYMSRLGLWGAGSAFDDFEAFLDSMKKRGVSFLEMLVRHATLRLGQSLPRGLTALQAQRTAANLIPLETTANGQPLPNAGHGDEAGGLLCRSRAVLQVCSCNPELQWHSQRWLLVC
jgi:P-loop containing NTP hydrolase pore-1